MKLVATFAQQKIYRRCISWYSSGTPKQNVTAVYPPSNNHGRADPPCRGQLVFQGPRFHFHDCFRECTDTKKDSGKPTSLEPSKSDVLNRCSLTILWKYAHQGRGWVEVNRTPTALGVKTMGCLQLPLLESVRALSDLQRRLHVFSLRSSVVAGYEDGMLVQEGALG